MQSHWHKISPPLHPSNYCDHCIYTLFNANCIPDVLQMIYYSTLIVVFASGYFYFKFIEKEAKTQRVLYFQSHPGSKCYYWCSNLDILNIIQSLVNLVAVRLSFLISKMQKILTSTSEGMALQVAIVVKKICLPMQET